MIQQKHQSYVNFALASPTMGGQTGGQKGRKRKAGNQGVGVDFKRVKHKVGKKLPKAQNETETSFKARSINLPSQGLSTDKEGIATNSQNLTLKVLGMSLVWDPGPFMVSSASRLLHLLCM